jgi:hypothetical protein
MLNITLKDCFCVCILAVIFTILSLFHIHLTRSKPLMSLVFIPSRIASSSETVQTQSVRVVTTSSRVRREDRDRGTAVAPSRYDCSCRRILVTALISLRVSRADCGAFWAPETKSASTLPTLYDAFSNPTTATVMLSGSGMSSARHRRQDDT